MAAKTAAGSFSVSRRKRGQIPTKRGINLAGIGKKPIKLGVALPAILLILAAAFAFGKFAVADRLMEVSRAQGEAAAVRSRVDESYRRLDSFGELSDLYAHYTYSGMTDEEVHRADRADVLNLLRDVVLPRVSVESWTLKGNTLTINMTAANLQIINSTVQKIEAEDTVSFCSVNTAKTNEIPRSNVRAQVESATDISSVTAQVVAYLNPVEGVDRG